ncbi:hypothetical protein J2R76_005821 [Bradyrhizobium sp. USDA 4532]|uniref:hypothetical protein n=1 Tax=unclassified Bradyrhizobium TaxID=2631580 RepID=UPI00209F19AF|nr:MULTISPECIES: hypothetical protein [unclassified Bradyrhizobium]MCP1829121.1 hypothetical protein [Bradyrhizobium sp. USDA 4545]MCP1922230.1 hypothetical protein [Bradyrhizobium sp. USDA 4532]
MTLYKEHQAALKELEAAKQRSLRLNPALKGGTTDVERLQAFEQACADMGLWSAECTRLAGLLAKA